MSARPPPPPAWLLVFGVTTVRMERKSNLPTLVHEPSVFRDKHWEGKQVIKRYERSTWAPWCSTASNDAAPATLNRKALETVS
ncbi:hypothetical protein FBY21_1287 [Pseudomonas sp. SLBN-26]|nr:hypothetical protein [Pseudomonas otitidis]TQL05935.1 hypothetical protein FBY21_1287 [Pseudomonas sp. SLBN-26]